MQMSACVKCKFDDALTDRDIEFEEVEAAGPVADLVWFAGGGFTGQQHAAGECVVAAGGLGADGGGGADGDVFEEGGESAGAFGEGWV